MMSKKKKISQESNSTFGLILLFLSLCCDGVCGMQQDIVVPRFKPSSLRLQQMLNIYGIIVSIITAIFQSQLLPGISFLLHNKICLWVFEISFLWCVVCCPVWPVFVHRANVYFVYCSSFPSTCVVHHYNNQKVF